MPCDAPQGCGCNDDLCYSIHMAAAIDRHQRQVGRNTQLVLLSTTTMSPTNYSLYCVPAAWVLSILPHFYAASVAGRGGKFDNTNPRNAAKNLESKLTKSDFGRYQRAEAAQQNGFENIALFATAVLVANQAKLPIDTVNTASFFYLASR